MLKSNRSDKNSISDKLLSWYCVHLQKILSRSKERNTFYIEICAVIVTGEKGVEKNVMQLQRGCLRNVLEEVLVIFNALHVFYQVNQQIYITV